MSTMRLIELLNACGLPLPEGMPLDTPVTGVTADSRQVKPGMVFAALPGAKDDGGKYAAEARGKGAVLVLGERCMVLGEEKKTPSTKRQAPNTIDHPTPRLAFARLAAAFYGPQPESVVAVTGTDGKTSTAEFFRQLSGLRGVKAASIGTLGTLGENRAELAAGLNTTPDPAALHQTLQTLAAQGYARVAMEASSHGLHQYRLDGVRLKAAAFTNLTRDHLDYHGDEEAYFAAKLRLFSELLPEGGTAVLNADEPRFEALHRVAARRRLKLITYGKQASDLVIESLTPHAQGQTAALEIMGRPHRLELPLVGAFQAYNMLAAMGLMMGIGEAAEALAPLLPRLTGVPGRLERVGERAGAAVYIDYAHTPAALANVLRTLRAHTAGRLIVVFGCGGDRDKGKRPLMGQAARALADAVVVTDDNPRGEDPALIRAEVMAGCINIPPASLASFTPPACGGTKGGGGGAARDEEDAHAVDSAEGFPPKSPRKRGDLRRGRGDVTEVADRRAAIYAAVEMLSPGDVLLVAGKGHEKTQVIGGVSHPFDDAEVIREAIATP